MLITSSNNLKQNLQSPTTRKISSREKLAIVLKNTAFKHKNQVERIDEFTWKFKDITVDNQTSDYIIKLSENPNHPGRTYKKRDLYRITEDSTQKVELGQYKRKYLYQIINKLMRIPRDYLKQPDMEMMIKLNNDVRMNRSNYHENNNIITGKCKDIGDIEINLGYIKHMKNNHNRVFGRVMKINGQVVAEGYVLNELIKSFYMKHPRLKMTY